MTSDPTDRHTDAAVWLFWCKTRDGQIVESTTTAYEGHKGHVRCQQIEQVTDD